MTQPFSTPRKSRKNKPTNSGRNLGIGVTLFAERSWDVTEKEQDLYLYSLGGDRKPLSFGERMQYLVLQNAISDLYAKNPEIRRDAEDWIASDEATYVFSFRSVCLTFGFDPGAVRGALVDKRWDYDVLKLRTNGRR